MSGHQIATSDSAVSVTSQCELYSDLLGGGPAWLDTVGWEDRKKDDSESFKDILRWNKTVHSSQLTPAPAAPTPRFILEAEMTDLLAVVWCVTPQVRQEY